MNDSSGLTATDSSSPAPGPRMVTVVFWLVVGLLGWSSLGPIWFQAIRPTQGRVNDFYQDWGSARNYVTGAPVYSAHSWSVPRHLGLAKNPNATIEYNAHPPASVLLALPLAGLDFPDAVRAWNLLTLAGFLVALGLVVRGLGLGVRTVLAGVALLAYCHPVYGNVYQGQLTLLLVLLLVGAWVLDRSGRGELAGVLIGVAAAIKLFPAYLFLIPATRRDPRPIVWGMTAFGLVNLVAVLVLGLDTYRDYLAIVLPDQSRFRSFGFNIAMAGFWYKLFDPASETGLITPLYHSPAMARVGTLVSDVVVTAVVVIAVARGVGKRERDLSFGLAVVGMLLVSPVTWDFSLPLLIVPAAVLARELLGRPWSLALLVAAAVVAWIPQSLFMLMVGEPDGPASPTYMLGAPALKFYVLLTLFGLLARDCLVRENSRGIAAESSPFQPRRVGITLASAQVGDGPR